MAKTARDLIQAAARTAGIIDALESLDSLEASHALSELNNTLEMWNIDELFPYTNVTEDLAVPPSNGLIEYGPTGADIVGTRPSRVISVALVYDTRYKPLRFVDKDSFANATRITEGSEPEFYTIQTDYPNVTIQLYPAASSYPIQITSQVVLSDVGLNDEIALPDGYYPALQYQLAHDLAVHYGVLDNVMKLEQMATDRLARVKCLNNKPRLLGKNGTPRGRGRWDINTGSFR